MSEILPDPRKRKPLVSIERQYETDVATGQTEVRVFIKFYIEARDSGLLAALGDRMCRTLICMATYMDENGYCYPSQDLVARNLGIQRQAANIRINELLAFRFNGYPVFSMHKTRVQTPNGSRWGRNVYRIHPISGFAIFDQPKTSKEEKPLSDNEKSYVRKTVHRPMYAKPDTGKPDTNQNQVLNKKVLTPLPSNDHNEKRKRTPTISDRALRSKYGLAAAQLARVHYLVGKQGDVLGSIERDHGHFVERAAEAIVTGHEDLLDETLSRFKEIARKRSPKSYPAYFQTMWNEAVEKTEVRARREQTNKDGHPVRRGGFEPLGDILRESKGGGEANTDEETSFA